MMSVQSKDQTGMKRISDGYQRIKLKCQKLTFVSHALAYAALVR